MKKLKEKELEDYFKSEKSDWFDIIDDHKFWDEEKVNLFWERIRKYKVQKSDLNFEGYIFPTFDLYERDGMEEGEEFCSFFLYDEEKIFKTYANFSFCKFLGNVNFSNFIIYEKLNFKHSYFSEDLNIDNSTLNSNVDFSNVNFRGDLSFSYVKFNSEVNFGSMSCDGTAIFVENRFMGLSFIGSEFRNRVYFSGNHFKGEVELSHMIFFKVTNFYSSQFFNKVSFSHTDFEEDVVFNNLSFKESADFSYCNFEKIVSFNDVSFFKEADFDRAKFKTLKLTDINDDEINKVNPQMFFSNVNFGSDTFLSRIDLSNTVFHNCDLSEINFSRCTWNYKHKRLVLKNEEFSFTDSEEHYRQLKKNFDGMKNWELSGYAYVSEMEMRKRSLWKEKKYFEWVIYAFYGNFGGYTQNIKKPLTSLFGLIVTFSIIYYFIDFNWLKAIQRGVNGAIPYIQIDTENPFTGYWLILRNIEFLLGATFLTFFVLALRKRFKQ